MRLILVSWSFAIALSGQSRIDLDVDGASLRGQRMPVSVRIDNVPTGYPRLMQGKRRVPFRLSESMERGEAGTISWMVDDPGRLRYELYFGPVKTKERPTIGVGDALHYNRIQGLDPLAVGMKNDQPIAVDWDGDGKTDLMQRNLYSSGFGEAQWGLFYWRNVGTNAVPQFARFVRLQADGKQIEDPYASYQVADFDGDGRLDIWSGIGAGPHRGELRIYRNTGKRDATGLPVLRVGASVPWGPGGELTYGMRVLGDLFTLRMKVQYFPTPEVNHTFFRHKRNGDGFGVGEAVRLGGSDVYDSWPSTMFDVDGDGKLDFVGSTRGGPGEPLKTCVLAWKKADDGPTCIFDTSPEGFVVPAAANEPGLRGLLLGYMGGWLRYLPYLGASAWGKPQLMLAEEMPISFGGYSSVEVADWEGDGDLDLIAGNENGYVQLVENLGGGRYATARQIPLEGGGTMYAARWQFIDDMDPERPFGQAKPAYVDWDGDGDLDMLVGNNSNRIAYFENIGTRSRPRFAPMRKLLHDEGEHFSFRSRPAPVDWNGDGLMDLVAGAAGARNRNDSKDIAVCVYLRYRDARGVLRLRSGKVLQMVDGNEMRTPIPYHHGYEVVDWDGDGDLDLLANEKTQLVLYRNEQGRFRRELLRFFGVPISVSHHETSLKAVDWDRDGKLDLITGGESGWVYYFHRSTLENATAPIVKFRTERRRR